MQNIKGGYRPDIDGLRAVAVIAVILYHFKIGSISGGFVGVDIFFVISGYLITRIITEQWKEHQRVNLGEFYLRRVRRLLPALIVTIGASYLTALFLFSPSDFKSMSGSAVYALAGIPNIFFWLESGYFDSSASIKPLLHTWSLGVEIQFYLIWPILLLGILRKTTHIKVTLLALIALGATSAVLFLKSDASGAFFLTPFRVHEFLLGGLVTFIERHKFNKLVSNAVYATGMILVAYAIFVFSSETTLFPGLAALVPAAGAALMILGGRNSTLAYPLSSWPAVKIGEISYSLYLVHWPVFVFTSYTLMGNVTPLHKLWLICCTLVLATALYYLVEKFFRHQQAALLSGPAFSLATALASIVLIIPAASSWTQNGWTWRIPAELREIGNIDERSASIYVFELIKSLNEAEGFDTSSEKEKILVIGDSQAGDLMNILNEDNYLSKFNVISRLVDSACGTPLLEKDKQDSFFKKINPITMKQPEYIKRCETGIARADDQKLLLEADKIFIAFYWRDFAEPYYLDAINKLASRTKAEIYIFGRKDLLKDSAFIATTLGRSAGLSHYAATYKSPETEKINAPLRLIRNVKYIDMMQATCPSADQCLVIDGNNKPVFFNATHLSKEGAKMYGPVTRRLLDEAMVSPSARMAGG
jgi:peptidoglycan/LPS O-acetylase OafA/YrhL